jgi:hypothetical protein
MPAQVYAVPLPVFDEGEKLGAALDAAGVVAGGGLVSRQGDRYFLHDAGELMALRAKQRDNETLRDVRVHGRELKAVDLGEQMSAGLRLVKPKQGEAHNALREIFSDIGLETPAHRSFGEVALVFSHSRSAFIVVGKSYHCSKYNEVYDQAAYDRNNGECPLHEGATLVLIKGSL